MITPQHREAKRKRDDGETRESQARRIPPHPSIGGTTGYSLSQRIHCLTLANGGIAFATGRQYNAPSKPSIYRWRVRLHHKHPTGNKGYSKLRGINLLLLLIYRLIFPRATADEIRRYLWENSPDPVLFSRKDICVKEKQLGFTTKRASIMARQAFREDVIARREVFWTEPLPLGALGVDIARFIDIDEMKLNLQSTNRRYGKSLRGDRIVDEGAYGHDIKYTLIMAIGGNGFKHISFEQVAGMFDYEIV
mgnify:CR=1 FL=1